ncbi:type II toxin-antitoxin system PemK/MazF family toxin [Rhodoferax sp.]|uniref:type II toxin-antitoxin system PemK/MazF family toxin n=1 Tax=Rhodoferax sp. TaxID=50421 RepID=UPI00260BBF71|nr:type II toxin-antitoxin system PemK/MazF family toxin [Rhodoferax sp.]MDD2810312.1 type II toxin-antitoxin system PemK/MazF family toxin [Rhodoferax sp.]
MTPDRGDILHLKFDPASGREMKGNHFCMVVSPRAFNARFKLAMVCPISGGVADIARNAGFLVSLMGQGLRTDGQVHVHQVKSLDWASRQTSFVERAPDMVVQEVLDCLRSVLDD